MSKLNRRESGPVGLGYVVTQLNNTIREQGVSFCAPEHTNALVSFESLDEHRAGNATAVHQGFEATLKETFKAAFEATGNLGLEDYSADLTDAQAEAGAMVLGAFGSPKTYATKAYKNMSPRGSDNVQVVGATASSFGIEAYDELSSVLSASLEAFDEQELRSYVAWSAAFNVLAARQDDFSEAFFPTVVLTPDQAGLDITIRRTMVLFEVQHRLNGAPIDFDKKNLIEAVIDHTILQNDSNRLYPVVVPTGGDANLDKFVAAGDVAAANVTIDEGIVVSTAPLKVGVSINLLGISQRTDIQTQGQFNSTDNLDGSLRLENLYLKIVNGDGTSVVKFPVRFFPRNQWVKSVEGRGRELNLNFVTQDLKITGATKNVAGVVAPALDYLADPARATWTVDLALSIGGQADVETGTISANPGTVTVARILEDVAGPDGQTIKVDVTAANKAALETALGAITVIGYDVYATRCNANLRTRGLLLNSVDYTERYTVQLGSPLTIPSPVGANRDASDLATLINAVRVRNSNNAVTTILNYADALSALENGPTSINGVPAIEGIARLVLRRPYYHVESIDLLAHINSIKSQDRILDVQQALVNVIRDQVYRMYRDSGYQAALDALTGNSGETPMVLIGTDARLAQYLLAPGDTRTLGNGLDAKIVVSNDQRVYGKIIVTLTRKNQNGADPLSFGQFAWVPELAATVQVSRGGATTKETMVQTRSRHVVNLPIMAQFTITNLDKAVTETIVYKTDEV